MNRIFESNVSLKGPQPKLLLVIFQHFLQMSEEEMKKIADYNIKSGNIDKFWIDTYWEILNNRYSNLRPFYDECNIGYAQPRDPLQIEINSFRNPETLKFKEGLSDFEKNRIMAILGVFHIFLKTNAEDMINRYHDYISDTELHKKQLGIIDSGRWYGYLFE